MKINKVFINNYKSLVNFEVIEPEPFTVFFGTNASGKSNIFEAIELLQLSTILGDKAITRFGKSDDLFSYTSSFDKNKFTISFDSTLGVIEASAIKNEDFNPVIRNDMGIKEYFRNYTTRLNIDHEPPLQMKDDKRLSHDAHNLNLVLKRILNDGSIKEEFMEWMELLIPEFENIDFQEDEYSGESKILVYEKNSSKPFSQNLISNGTKNIIALFTALYQTSKPQFLLIEEPENGLNPKVIQELTRLFRDKCNEDGTNIWLNTHSQTLVSEITTKEAILVEKAKGRTEIKPLRDFNTFSLKVDQAWLMNVFDGGLPW